MRQFLVVLVFGASLLGGVGAQQLSNTNQAEALQGQIADATKAKNWQGVLSLIDEYRRLGMPPNTAYYYIEAVAAYAIGQRARALSAAATYLNAPDGQQYRAAALALYNAVQEQNAKTAKNEMQIRWITGVTSKPGIRRGQAIVKGQTIEIDGLTLRCEIWDYQVLNPQQGTKVMNPNGEPPPTARSYSDGRDSASRIMLRRTDTFTFHLIDPESADPGDAYHKPPWEGWYNWRGFWSTYAQRPNIDKIVVWGGTDVDVGTVYFPDSPTGSFNELMAKFQFEIDLSTGTAHESTEPYYSPPWYCSPAHAGPHANPQCTEFLQGYRSVTEAKDAACVPVAYRQPPDPEPSAK